MASRPSDSDSSSKSVGGSSALRGGSVLLPAPLPPTGPALDAEGKQKQYIRLISRVRVFLVG